MRRMITPRLKVHTHPTKRLTATSRVGQQWHSPNARRLHKWVWPLIEEFHPQFQPDLFAGEKNLCLLNLAHAMCVQCYTSIRLRCFKSRAKAPHEQLQPCHPTVLYKQRVIQCCSFRSFVFWSFKCNPISFYSLIMDQLFWASPVMTHRNTWNNISCWSYVG